MGIALDSSVSFSKSAEVYAVVSGIPVELPKKAKYICQDRRGSWFFCMRKPRIKNGDWTPNKVPIQVANSSGTLLVQVLQTPVVGSWKKTLQTTVKKCQLPVSL